MATKAQRDKAAQLYSQFQRLKRTHDRLHQAIASNVNQYFMAHWLAEGPANPGEERITLPTCTNTVEMANAVLLSQKRSIHVIPTRQTNEAQNITSELEKWLQGVFYVNELRSGEDRVALALWDALVKRMGWIRYRWDTAYVEETMEEVPPFAAPVEGAEPPQPVPMMVCKECPIVIDHVPPENVYVQWGGNRGIMYLFYAAKRTLEDVEAEVGRIKIPKFKDVTWEGRATTEVEFLEYWGWDGQQLTMATMVDNDFIPGREWRPVEGYADIPYVPIYCFRTGMSEPHLKARGIIDNMKDLVHVEEKLVTRQNHALNMFSFMPLLAQAGQSNQPVEVDARIGNVIHLKPGQSVSFPQYPGTPPDFKWHLSLVEEKVQESGFPGVSFGQGPASLSGYAITQYAEGGRARLDLPRHNYALALTKLCQGFISLAEHFAPDAAIPVFGRYKNRDFYSTLTGSAMKGHVLHVNISSDLPGDDVRKSVIGGQLKAQGIPSERTIMEKWLGIENVEDEQQQILREQAMKHPVVKLKAIAQALAEDESPFARAIMAQVVKGLQELEAPPNMPQPPAASMEPPPMAPPAEQPMGVPGGVVPAIAQGQVLPQELGMSPNQAGVV